MNQLQSLQQTANKAEEILDNQNEWISRYAGYANEITRNLETIKEIRRCFQEKEPLYVYSSISKVKSAKKEELVTFDLRYRGQSVANIKYGKKGLLLKTNENTGEFYGIKGGESIDWNSKEAEVFRGGFAKYPSRKKTKKENEEHRYESALLTELSKKEGSDKKLKFIQPVRLATSRFQMPTPFSASSASKGNIKYSAHNGGGIDLLCRTKHGNKSILNIFELKDEYEDPFNVLHQAVAYSVFIHKLLRTSNAGSEIWWKLFGFNKVPDDPLRINAVVALPKFKENDTSFAKKEIIVDGGVIQLHYFYFTLSKNDKVGSIDTSLFSKKAP